MTAGARAFAFVGTVDSIETPLATERLTAATLGDLRPKGLLPLGSMLAGTLAGLFSAPLAVPTMGGAILLLVTPAFLHLPSDRAV